MMQYNSLSQAVLFFHFTLATFIGEGAEDETVTADFTVLILQFKYREHFAALLRYLSNISRHFSLP